MQKKVVLAASVLVLLVCVGIAGSQRRAAFAKGVTPIVTPTKGSGTGVIKHVVATVVGVKRLSNEVIILALDTGMTVVINPSSGDAIPIDSISFNFTKIEFEYVNQSGDGRHEVAKNAKVLVSKTPSPTPTDIPIP
jgi:hypothetical protein